MMRAHNVFFMCLFIVLFSNNGFAYNKRFLYKHNLNTCITYNNWYCAKKYLTKDINPGIKDFVLWNYYIRTHNSKDFDNLWDFIATHNQFPNQRKLQSNLENILPKNFSPYETISFFKIRPPITMEGKMRYVSALLQLHDYKLAKHMIYTYWTGHVMSYKTQKKFFKRYKKYIDQKIILQRFEYTMVYKKYTSSKWLISQLHDKKYLKLAKRQYYLMRRKANTRNLIDQKGASVYNLGLIYATIQYYYSHKKNEKAYYWINYLDRYPQNLNNASIKEKIDTIRLAIIQSFIYNHKYNKAFLLAQHLSNPYHLHSKIYNEIQFTYGWLALRRVSKPKIALHTFLSLYKNDTSVNGHARSSYWVGRSYNDLKEKALANKWYEYAATYPTTYYGQVATMYLAKGTSVVIHIASNPSIIDKEKFENHRLIQVVNAMQKYHYESKASPFILQLARQLNNPESLNLLAQKTVALGNPGLGIMVGRVAFNKNIVVLKYSYPTLNANINYNVNVPIWLVNAIIRQESGFTINATSSTNAKGLMQLMPSTAKYVSKQIGTRFGRKKLTTDPVYNVKLGSAYLNMLIRNFDSYVLAIAAYNAGPTNVKHWVNKFPDSLETQENYIDWIETIPFPETKHYIKRILIDSAIYHAMLDNNPKKIVAS